DSVVELETRILAKNDALAAKNRAWFAGREILALNLVSSPGAGKTTLLRALAGLIPSNGEIRIGDDALALLPLRERAKRFAYLPQG
ncbi:ATP-binding cassette domain-containing protein, partial [Acinetobacter baumannii]